MKKYELVYVGKISAFMTNMYQIKACRDIPRWGIQKGDLGGFVVDENSLSQDDDSWIDQESVVGFESHVSGDMLLINTTVDLGSIVRGTGTIKDSYIESSNVFIDNENLENKDFDNTSYGQDPEIDDVPEPEETEDLPLNSMADLLKGFKL